jgi:hypothetical protein
MINKESEFYDEFNDDYEFNAKGKKDKKEEQFEFENQLLMNFEKALASNIPKFVLKSLDDLFVYNILSEEAFFNYHKHSQGEDVYNLEHFFIKAFTSCIFKDNEKSLGALYDYTYEKAQYLFDDLERQFVGACASKCLWMTNQSFPELLKLEEHKSENSLLVELMTLRSPSHDMRVEMLSVILDVYETVPYKTKEILDTCVYSFSAQDKNNMTFNVAMPNDFNVIKLALLNDGSKSTDLLSMIINHCKKHNVSYELNDNFYTAPLNEVKNINALELLIKEGYDIKKHQYSFFNTLDFQWISQLYNKNLLENNEENQNTITSIFIRELNNMDLSHYQFDSMHNKINLFSEQAYINLKHCDYHGNIAHQYMKVMINYLEKSFKTNMDYEQYNRHVSSHNMLKKIKPIIETFEVLKQKGVDFEQVDMSKKKSIDYLKEFINSFENYPSHIKRDINELQVPLEKLSFTLMLNDNKPSRKIKI